MELTDLAIDVEAVENGEWFEEIPDFPGLALKVRGSNSTAFTRAYRQRLTLHRRALEADGDKAAELREAIWRDSLIEGCLIDWNVTDKGAPVSVSRAEEICADRHYAPLLDAIAWCARRIAMRRLSDLQEADAKLGERSAGAASGAGSE